MIQRLPGPSVKACFLRPVPRSPKQLCPERQHDCAQQQRLPQWQRCQEWQHESQQHGRPQLVDPFEQQRLIRFPFHLRRFPFQLFQQHAQRQ